VEKTWKLMDKVVSSVSVCTRPSAPWMRFLRVLFICMANNHYYGDELCI
jgi:hypothetical protein